MRKGCMLGMRRVRVRVVCSRPKRRRRVDEGRCAEKEGFRESAMAYALEDQLTLCANGSSLRAEERQGTVPQ